MLITGEIWGRDWMFMMILLVQQYERRNLRAILFAAEDFAGYLEMQQK